MLEREYLIEGGGQSRQVGGGDSFLYTFGVEGVRMLYRGFGRICVTVRGFIFFVFK